MIPRPAPRVAVRLLGALALLGLGAGCTPAGKSPTGLNTSAARITDEAIAEDLARLAEWQRKLDVVTSNQSRDPARRYLTAKANAWMAFAREEYWANDRGPVIEESTAEAVRLLGVLTAGGDLAVEPTTRFITGTREVRPDLWKEVARFKAHPRFDLVAEEVAQLELELVRAGHDAAEGAACSAEPHDRRAKSLSAYVDSVLKDAPALAPVVPITPVVPVPGPVAPDRDRDGVPDAIDCCPNTPAGRAVDATGCPEPTNETRTVLDGVEFDTDRFFLRAASRAILDSVVTELQRRPGIPVEISGHTDSIGDDAYNQRLSEDRAKSVRAYLIRQGVAESRLSAVGFGETRPRDTNSTRPGRQRNRRVELTWQQPVQLDLLPRCAVPVEAPPPVAPTRPDVLTVSPDALTGGALRFDTVYFETASVQLLTTEGEKLVRVAAQLALRDGYVLELDGHADDVGQDEANFALSLGRAYRVRSFLMGLGVPGDRILVRGFGSARPANGARTEEARALNRRVEVTFRPASQ